MLLPRLFLRSLRLLVPLLLADLASAKRAPPILASSSLSSSLNLLPVVEFVVGVAVGQHLPLQEVKVLVVVLVLLLVHEARQVALQALDVRFLHIVAE